MDAEGCRKLHEAIEEGDVDLVSRLMENHAAEQYFLHEGDSALYHAFSEEKHEIAALLISNGAKIHESEIDDLYDLEIDLTRVNHLLKYYNKKSDKSCIDKLMSVSQSRQGFKGPQQKAVRTMYNNLFESEIIKLLMMVLETIDFDVFYDFESEDVNRIHRLEKEEMEIFGLTLSNSKEIFVGAKNLMSGDPKKKAKVYGVVAEELCHLAMTTLFENGAKPYRKEQRKLFEDFCNIITAVESLAGRSCHLESSIKTIFTDYEDWQWECELIARVPYVIGFYGEETARGILMESSELSTLLSFYEENVVPKCREYTDPRLNTKAHRIMEELMKNYDLISSKEKTITPLTEEFPPFCKYLHDFPSFSEYPELKREGISVLTTNCTKLCTLHVFHEFKEKYGDLLKKKVLFLSRKCIKREIGKIVNSLKGSVWDYLIIVMNKKALNLLEFYCEYLEKFNEFLIKGMKIIMITSSQSIDQKFTFERALNYKWDDLTYEYKSNLEVIYFLFKGQEKYVYVEKGDFPEYFNEDEIMQIIGEVIEVDDGKDLYSQGYVPETYIERAFTATTVDGEFFDNIPRDTSVFLSGLSKKEFEEGLISKVQVQWLEKSDDKLQEDKSVYISKGNDFTTFMDLVGRNTRKTTIWLHHEKNVFYLKNLNSTSDEFKKHTKEASFSEKEILDFLKSKRILIISDNAGCGKSTVVSNLISIVRKNRSDSWIWRIDFNKFSNSEKDSPSLANLNTNSNEEEVFDYLCKMLRLNGGFEKYLFKKFSCRAGRCFIFFDGYDEIPSKYMSSALKILSTLKEKTAVKLIITSRKHQQEELEKMLDTYSHQLVPLSKKYQKEFLNKFWKNKFKDPKGKGRQRRKKDVTEKIKNIIDVSRKERTVLEYQELIQALEEIDLGKDLNSILSEIENLDFTNFAKNIIEKSSVDKEALEFIGIPLHLYMIGRIHFNDILNDETTYDIYGLYKSFLDQKILIYIEEKENLRKEGKLKEDTVKNTREDAFRIHTDLSIQLIDEGKVCLAKDLNEKDLELCTGLGVVYEHGGEIRFLHRTFAEFFIAESVRKTLRKEDIIKLISDDKYKVIRRFLSSSLENNGFGEVSNDLLQISCLSDVMARAKILTIRYNSDSYCAAKIIKNLLVNFEHSVEVSVVNKLIEKIESRIERKSHVGGFLTVSMMKHLLNRNFEVNYILFLHFVRFAESADDIIDVLTECIPLGSDGGTGSGLHKRSKKSEDLVLLLCRNYSLKKGLLHHAMMNGRVEIFARILKFFRDVFGKEQFLKMIIKNYEYKNEIENLISHEGIDKVCSFINALHNVFHDETKLLFHNGHKFWLLRKSVDVFKHKHGKVHLFQKVFRIFQVCFGSEELKESLLRRDSNGDYLIERLMQSRQDTQTLMDNLNSIKGFFDWEQLKELLLYCDSNGDYLIERLMKSRQDTQKLIDNLNSVKGFFDSEQLKELLLCCDSNGDYLIHRLMKSRQDTQTLIDNLNSVKGFFDSEQLKELLLCCDSNGDYLIERLIQSRSDTQTLMDNMNSVKGFFDSEQLKELLLYCDSNGDFLIERLMKSRPDTQTLIDNLKSLEGIIQHCDNILGKKETKEILLSDYDGNCLIHFLIKEGPLAKTMETLNAIEIVFNDDYTMEQFLKSKDKKLNNALHLAAKKYDFAEIIDIFGRYLQKKQIKDELLCENNDGRNVIYFLFKFNSSSKLIYNLNIVKKVIGEEYFKQLLKSKDSDNENIFHFAAYGDRILEDIIQYCVNVLGKEETKELLLSKDNNDMNIIHLLFKFNFCATLFYNLDIVKEFIGDECFKHLLKSKDSDNENILHFAASNDLMTEYTFLDLYLCEKEIADLFFERTVFGKTCLHYAANYKGMVQTDFINYAHQFIKCESKFEEFLLAQDNDGNTFIHSIIESKSIHEACDVFLFFDLTKLKVSIDVFNKLLRVRNNKGKTFLQMDSEYIEVISKYFEGILEKDLFEELLKESETVIMQEEY